MEFASLAKIAGENSPEQVGLVCATLVRLVEAILERPGEPALRRLRLDSADVAERLMPYSGGLELLFELGFEEDDDQLVLPESVSSDVLRQLVAKLKFLKSSTEAAATSVTSCGPDSEKLCASTLPAPPVRQMDQMRIQPRPPSAARYNINNGRFALRLQNTLDHVLIYENAELKRKALDKIPAERLREDARAKFYSYKMSLTSYEARPHDFNDFLALELQAWFKNEFFAWVNEPDCETCRSREHMRFSHAAQPVASEIVWLANNVEVYKCQQCGKTTRFPRYNHPEKLLETRRGRCGEWANCYCLCLRALDFDARYVLDWTDHVWCEVYSASQERWLHSDPCENALDKPLLYEHGWNKKLSYVIAFSFYQCLDVTWRYSSRHAEVMARRTECDELWLTNFTNELSRKRQVTLSPERREQIQVRLMREIVEFLSPKQIKEGEDVGRQSGSLQWRLSRGETHQTAEVVTDAVIRIDKAFVRPDNAERRLTLRYVSATDTYRSNFGEAETRGWARLVNRSANVARKVEHDWQMCYLARTPGAERAWLEWHVEVSGDTALARLELLCQSACYEDGQVAWTLAVADATSSVALVDAAGATAESPELSVTSLGGGRFQVAPKSAAAGLVGRRLVLRTELSRGRGDNAWQHAQLFRAKLDETDRHLFEISAWLV